MDDLPGRVRGWIARHQLVTPGEMVVVAVSGGADSLGLLRVLWMLRDEWGLRLTAATLDHGLRGAAGAEDVAYVQNVARGWGVPVIAGWADVPVWASQHGVGLEEAARMVRYTFLQRAGAHVGARTIAVGHHRDDQAETVLLHLVRGSGLDGLRGMLPVTTLEDERLARDVAITCTPTLAAAPVDRPASGWRVIRPLLDVSRYAIEAYVAACGLVPREDATNTDPDYRRNRIRHEVLPLLAALNPRVAEALARTADILREDAAWLDALSEALLAQWTLEASGDRIVLDRVAWDAAPPAARRRVLRLALRRLAPGLRDVTFQQVTAAAAIAGQGVSGAAASLPGGRTLYVASDRLIIGPAAAVQRGEIGLDAPALPDGYCSAPLAVEAGVRMVFGDWVFEAGPLPDGAPLGALHADPLAAALDLPRGVAAHLRTRHDGDRFAPRGMGGHAQKLADTLINMRVPGVWRDHVPLLVIGDAVAWFVIPAPHDLRGRVADAFAVHGDTPEPGRIRVAVRWQRRQREE